MSGALFHRRTGLVLLLAFLAVFVLTGCGKSEESSEDAADGEARSDGEQGPGQRDKLDSMELPEELPREWFYDGDGTYALRVLWHADDGKLEFQVTPERGRGRGKAKSISRSVVAFYRGDYLKGPHAYAGRVLGPKFITKESFRLNDVKDDYFRAVVYDSRGKPLYTTDSVRPEVKHLTRAKSKRPARRSRRSSRKSEKKEEKKEETETPRTSRTLVVIPLNNEPKASTNASDKKTAQPRRMTYYGVGLQQALREFLAGVPQIKTLDPGYVDSIMESAATRRPSNDVGLVRAAGRLQADQILLGSFQEVDGTMKVKIGMLTVQTRARLQVASVDVTTGTVEDAAAAIAKGIAGTLNIELTPEQIAPLQAALKGIEDRRLAVEKTLKAHDEEKHQAAITAFERLKPEEIADAEALSKIAESYAQLGQPLKAAALLATASRLSTEESDRDVTNDLARYLNAAGDLSAALNVLGDVSFEDESQRWNMALRLMNRFVARRVVKSVEASGPETKWPHITPVWQMTVDAALFNPHAEADKLVVFATTNDKAVQTMIPIRGQRYGRGRGRRLHPDPGLYETCVYDLAAGEPLWQRGGLFSGITTPALGKDKLFGVGEKGPVAVRLNDGKTVWKDTSGRIVHPELATDAALNDERSWWKTFETRVVGNTLIVWNPYDQSLEIYNAEDGTYKGRTYHNQPWAASGQYFLVQPDGLYCLSRGGGKLAALTQETLANPVQFTTRLRMVADSRAALQDGVLYETVQEASSARGGFHFFVRGTDAASGGFKWLYPILTPDPPVIAGGKLFLYKKSITGRESMTVRMIDVNAGKAYAIDLAGTSITSYTPSLAILDGTAVLIGSQAAVSAAPGKEGTVLWVNRNLPYTKGVSIVGHRLLVPPMVVDPKTGEIIMQLEVPRGFSWESTDVLAAGDRLVLFDRTVKRVNRQTAYQTVLSAYDLRPKGTQKKEAASPPTAAVKTPKRKKLSPDEIEKAFIECNVAAPTKNGEIYDLFKRVAALKYESSGDPKVVVEYLANWLKKRPRNADHLSALAAIMKPYAAAAGDYATLVDLLQTAGRDYTNKEVAKGFQDLATKLTAEEAEAERARAYLEKITKVKHDPLTDWPTTLTVAGIGSRGAGATPPFKQAWTRETVKGSEVDLIVPTDEAVLVLNHKKATLSAYDPDVGKPLWERELDGVRAVVYYRGLVYVVGKDVRAVTPAKGLTVWRKPLEPDEAKGNAAVTAGDDRVFVAVPGVIFALDWSSPREHYRITTDRVRRLELHGTALVVGRGPSRETQVYDAATGNRLWQRKTGVYTLLNGKMYDFQADYDKKKRKVNATLVCRHLRSGSELWRRYYDLGAGVRRAPTVIPPAVTPEHILLFCGKEMLLLGRGETPGEVMAKQTLGDMVSSKPVVTPTIVFVPTRGGKLTAYDVTNELSQVWQLPQGGHGAIAAASGTLYILDGGQLKSLRGSVDEFDETYQAAILKPDEALPAKADDATSTTGDTVKKDRFASIGMIDSKARLLAKMDDKRLGKMAFRLLVHTGKLSDWQIIIDEMYQNLPPGKRKVRGITDDEKRMLFAEIIQRRDADGMNVLKEAIRRGDGRTVATVLELMNTGDRSVYGPMVLQIFRQALKDGASNTATHCARTLGKWRFEAALTQLVNGMQNQKASGGTRKECAVALSQFDDNTRALGALEQCARLGAKSSLAKNCTVLLAKMGERGVEAVAKIMKDSGIDEPTRIEAVRALANGLSDQAGSHLKDALLSKRNPVKLRGEAAIALGTLDGANDKTLELLINVMNNTKNDHLLRNAAMHGLGSSRNVKAIPALIEVMGNRDVDTRKFLSVRLDYYLGRLSGRARVRPNPEEWRAWWEKNKDRLLRKKTVD